MNYLLLKYEPNIRNARMIVSFTGWMNGGEVSTGTVDYISKKLRAIKFAEIDPDPFYISSFPGTMDLNSEFRPYCKIEQGLLTEFSFPKNEFYCHEESNLILFKGKEPHIHWKDYAKCLLELGKKYGLKRIYFIGSVAAATPHTRGIGASCYCSNDNLIKEINYKGTKLTAYEGPGSFTTYLTFLAKQEGFDMINFVAEIPIYIQSENPKAIKAITDKLISLLNLQINTADLTKKTLDFEKRIHEFLLHQPQLADEIKKLEENYDKEFFADKGGFEEWLRKKGIDKL